MDETWVFTFGFGHCHPFTGESLANCYVIVQGDVETTRTKMIERFGNKWAFQYVNEDEAGVEKYGLTQIEWIETVKKDY